MDNTTHSVSPTRANRIERQSDFFQLDAVLVNNSRTDHTDAIARINICNWWVSLSKDLSAQANFGYEGIIYLALFCVLAMGKQKIFHIILLLFSCRLMRDSIFVFDKKDLFEKLKDLVYIGVDEEIDGTGIVLF